MVGDPNLFVVGEFVLSAGALTSMVEIPHASGAQSYWISDYSGTWGGIFTSALSTYGNPLATYLGSGTSSLVTAAVDLGSLYGTGNAIVSAQWTNLTGTAAIYIEVSPDNAAWTQLPAGSTAVAVNVRYVRVRIETTGVVLITALGTVFFSIHNVSNLIDPMMFL